MVHIDINEQIQAFAKSRRIKPEKFEQFKTTIIQGLPVIGLDKDNLNMDKMKRIAGIGGGAVIVPEPNCDYPPCDNPISSYRCKCGKWCCFKHCRFDNLNVIACAVCDETLRGV